ncbi:MAG: CapA family protein [Firmicutes bacterium]|nr:CapA family protein [Bacillota bacterium]
MKRRLFAAGVSRMLVLLLLAGCACPRTGPVAAGAGTASGRGGTAAQPGAVGWLAAADEAGKSADTAGRRASAGGQSAGRGQQGEGHATLAFVGDILLADRIGDLIRRDGADAPWAGVADILQQADLAVGNLETSVGQGGVPQEGKQYTFQAWPEALQGLAKAGVGMVGLGNNHVLDFGSEGLKKTLAALDEVGVAHTGAGLDQREAWRPVLRDVRGVTVGFLSFSRVVPEGWAAAPKHPGVASAYDEAGMLRLVRDTAARCDVLAVSIHWGEENKQQPSVVVQKLAHRLVDAGADLVIGHHPHVWQGLSTYHGALIAYSVGNFIFTTSNPIGVQTGVLLADVSRQGVAGGRIVPARIDWGRTVKATPAQAGDFFRRIRAFSDLSLDDQGAFRLTERRRSLGARAEPAWGDPARVR